MTGHALVVAAAVCCLLLGRWQLGRAEITHSMQNMAYALQWPLFAVFFVVMWLRMLRLESRRLDEEAAAERASAEPSTAGAAHLEPAHPGPAAPDIPEPAGVTGARAVGPESGDGTAPLAAEEDDPELAAYNRMLAALAARDRESERRR
jgi:DNA-binding transcriptional regulator of glucitol operon